MATGDNELVIQISATTALLQQQLIRAEGQIERFRKEADSNLGRIDKSFSSLGGSVNAIKGKLSSLATVGVTALVGTLGASLVQATKDSLDFAGSLGETANKMGVTTKFLQEFRYAASQSGASVEDSDKALTKFNLTLGQALDGGAGAQAGFDRLGVSIVDATGKARTADQVYADVARAIAEIPDPARQASAAQAIFGRGFSAILPLLKEGAVGFANLASQANRYGLVLSDTAIAQADEAADKIDALNQVLKANIAGVVANNAQAISGLANSILDLANAMGQSYIANRQRKRNGEIRTSNPGIGRTVLFDDAFGIGTIQYKKGRFMPKGGRGGGRFDPTGQFTRTADQVIAPRPSSSISEESALPSIRSIGGGVGRARGGRISDFATDAVDPISADIDAAISKLDESAREWMGNVGSVLREDVARGATIFSAEIDEIEKRKDSVFEDRMQKEEARIRTTADLYETLMTQGTGGFLKVLEREGIRIIAMMAAQMLAGKSLSAAFGTAAGSGLFGGFFANGGQPPVGRMSIVGERGPEVFIPKVPGTIIPNHALGGGPQISLTVNAPGATQETVMMIRRELANAAPHIVQAAQQSTVRSLKRPRL